jgi:hypothetical protein
MTAVWSTTKKTLGIPVMNIASNKAAIVIAAVYLTAMTSFSLAAEQDPVAFRTPSGNIHCLFFTEEGKTKGVVCDMNQAFTRMPIRPKPSDCEFDWGQRFALGGDSDAGLECASDSVMSNGSLILGYGTSIKQGGMSCFSEQAGLTCKNEKAHGFFLSRRAQRLF